MCTNLRLGLSVQAKSSLNFRESLLLCMPPSYAMWLLPVCIISWAPLEKKKQYKHYTVCKHCLKTQWGGAQVLFWNAFAVGLGGILGVLMLQLMNISTIVDEKLPLLLIKCSGPVHGLTCKIYSCAPIWSIIGLTGVSPAELFVDPSLVWLIAALKFLHAVFKRY